MLPLLLAQIIIVRIAENHRSHISLVLFLRAIFLLCLFNVLLDVFITLDIPKCPAELYDLCEFLLEYIATSS